MECKETIANFVPKCDFFLIFKHCDLALFFNNAHVHSFVKVSILFDMKINDTKYKKDGNLLAFT